MSTETQHKAMLRKPIMMPPSLIEKVDVLAKQKKVSFAEVVREAVAAFDGQPTSEDELFLEILADTMIQTTEDFLKNRQRRETP